MIVARAEDTLVQAATSDPVAVSVVNSNPNLYADTVLADGPVAYWRLGEASGSSAFDASGNNIIAAYVGGPNLGMPALVSATPDPAVGLDGVDDAVYVPQSSLINLGLPRSERTVEIWFRADDTTSTQILFEEGGLSRGLSMYVSGGELWFGGWNPTNDGPNSAWGPLFFSTPVTSGATHHAVMVLEGEIEGFLDGFSAGVSGPAGWLYAHGNRGAIGAMQEHTLTHTGSQFFNGLGFLGDDR